MTNKLKNINKLKLKRLGGTIVAFSYKRGEEGDSCGWALESRRDVLIIDLPKPVDRKGLKSVECPFYGDWPMHAARRNWHARTTCEVCPNLELDSVCLKLKSVMPYYRLLSEIYPEFKRKYDPVMESLHVGAWSRYSC